MIILRKIRLAAACIISSVALISTAMADDVITFAEADTITGESLVNLIAFERAKERGVWKFFNKHARTRTKVTLR